MRRHRRARARGDDDRQLARERAHERLRHPPRSRAVPRVEGRLPAAHLPPREHDLVPGAPQQRLGVGDRLREGEVAETGREELDGRHRSDSMQEPGARRARAPARRSGPSRTARRRALARPRPCALPRAGSPSSPFTRSAIARGERLRVARRPRRIVDRVERDEQARHAVLDDLGDPAGRRGDDGGLAGHRLEVDDPERLVDRGADEDRGVREELDHLRLRPASARSRRRRRAPRCDRARAWPRSPRRAPACRARPRRARAAHPGRSAAAASSR